MSFLERRRPGRRGWRALPAVVLAVLALHGLLIGGFDSLAQVAPPVASEPVQSVMVAPPAEAPPPIPEPPLVIEPAAPIQPRPAPAVRRHRPAPKVIAAAPVAELPAAPAEPAETAAAPIPDEPASAASAVAEGPTEPASEAIAATASDAPAASAPVAAAAASAVADSGAASAPAPLPVAEPMPVYPTAVPPAFSFVYDLSRSPLTGNGSLVLRFTDDGYEARLQGSVAGFNVLEWVSTGAIDANGFAPVRFTEQRLRRAMTAANFQRALGKITYSASSDSVPLPAGAQDRLSWMLQLAAIAHKHPEKLIPGDHITMFVSGVRADAEPWTFTVIGTEDVRAPIGVINATVHLVREPRMPHDTRADVWLDPSRHHLPARARLSNSEDGSDAFELKLREAPESLP